MTDYALDMVAIDPQEAIAGLLPYAETDTLCYRADPEEALFARQQEVWEPVLTSFEARHGLRFERVCGIIHRAQPEATLAALRSLLEAASAFDLAALRNLSSLAASLVIALAALEADGVDCRLTPAPGLDARHVVEHARRHECVATVVVGRPAAWAAGAAADPWAKLDCPLVAASDHPDLPKEQ